VCKRALAQITIWIGSKEEKMATVPFVPYSLNRVHDVVRGLPAHDNHEGDPVETQE
jgi:hypothetical protein